jgi:hypothetical protein
VRRVCAERDVGRRARKKKIQFVTSKPVAKNMAPNRRGIAVILGERRVMPFACVTPVLLNESDNERDGLLAQWCLGLGDNADALCEGDSGEGAGGHRSGVEMHLLPSLLERQISAVKRMHDWHAAVESESGLPLSRRGPRIVRIDKQVVFGGHMKMCSRGLQLESHSNFVTARSRSGFVHGCWVYEVVVHTGGHIHVGWVTSQCHLSEITGVGDTPQSVAFDGQRALKWNRKEVATYGKPWVPGDVVGCCINLEMGEASFYLNGESLGVAYSNLRRGQGLVYYPAVSLAHAERCTLNFGALPFEYDYFLDPPSLAQSAGAELEASSVDERVQSSRYSALEIRPSPGDRACAQYLATCLSRVCRLTANPALDRQADPHELLGLCDKLLSWPADADPLCFGSDVKCRGGKNSHGRDKGCGSRGKVWAENYGPGSWSVLAASSRRRAVFCACAAARPVPGVRGAGAYAREHSPRLPR